MKIIKFFVPGPPVGKGRPRAARRGKHITLYTPAKTVSYESLVAMAATQAMAGRPPLDGPVVLVLDIALPVPQSWSKKRQAAALADITPPTTKPDCDNVLKAICDAANNIVWRDDVQVVDVVLRRRYRETPGVHVAIEPYEPLTPRSTPQLELRP